jgi:predicted Zn-ribbon and HTH transcriptional regulator
VVTEKTTTDTVHEALWDVWEEFKPKDVWARKKAYLDLKRCGFTEPQAKYVVRLIESRKPKCKSRWDEIVCIDRLIEVIDE